jgi:hypothetical protein
MQRLLAIAWLTWKAAFRFRLFLVVAVLLLASVVGLPLLVKDDGTARGFTQILLTYTLTSISAFLGVSTLWLACGTLARDIEECQIQIVAVKPIARWQIWLGKWLGIASLNAALLALSGASVYALLQWRATRLPLAEQQVLRNEVLVARGSARQRSFDSEIQAEADRQLAERLQKNPVTTADLPEVRRQILEQVKADYQIVGPADYKTWEINLGRTSQKLRDQPLYVRLKFNTADSNPNGTFAGVLYVGMPRKTQLWRSELMHLAPETFHEFPIGANVFDENGVVTLTFVNVSDKALLFPLEDGFEVLYPESSFTVNYLRGLGIIFCWMAVLAALGLAAASFLSFPVAAFLSLTVLGMVLSSSTLSTAIEQGTIGGWNAEKGTAAHTPVDSIVIPAFRGILNLINLAMDFSPIDSLSSGRSITWGQLALAFGQVVLLLGGILACFGIAVFHRRELAAAQGVH